MNFKTLLALEKLPSTRKSAWRGFPANQRPEKESENGVQNLFSLSFWLHTVESGMTQAQSLKWQRAAELRTRHCSRDVRLF